jgi:AraC-like DNA-binding protein
MMYTGYIVHAFYLVDFSESMGLLIGPLFYFVVLSLTQGRVKKIQYLHLLPFVIYSCLLSLFLMLPEDAKYNAWVGSFRPDLPYREYEYPYDTDPLGIRRRITEIVLVSIFSYTIFSLVQIIKAFRLRKESFWKPVTPALRTLRRGALVLLSVSVLIVIVKLMNRGDTGDHIFATYVALTVYLTSFSVMRDSGFFRQAPLNEQMKYKNSPISPATQEATLKKLAEMMEGEKLFVRQDFSLPDLAKRLNVSVHALSQMINDGLGKNFFELMAEHRVAEAKRLLREQLNVKVEEIAGQVGYNSKSSFNTVFKKHTGMTPSEYRAKM